MYIYLFYFSTADDGEKSEGNLDVNGNPLLEHYTQMRQPLVGPKSDLANSSANGNGSDIGHQNDALEVKKQRRQRKQERQKQNLTTASKETIKDFKGDQPVTDLIAFIEGSQRQPLHSPDNSAKTNKKQKKVLNGLHSPDAKATLKKGNILREIAKYSNPLKEIIQHA